MVMLGLVSFFVDLYVMLFYECYFLCFLVSLFYSKLLHGVLKKCYIVYGFFFSIFTVILLHVMSCLFHT